MKKKTLFVSLMSFSVLLANLVGIFSYRTKNVESTSAQEITYEKVTSLSSISTGDKVIFTGKSDSFYYELMVYQDKSIGAYRRMYTSEFTGSFLFTVSITGYTSFTFTINDEALRPKNREDAASNELCIFNSPNSNEWVVSFDESGNVRMYDSFSYLDYSEKRYIYCTDSSFVYSKTQQAGYFPIQIYKQVITYKVSYDANGGTGEMDDSNNYISENAFTCPTGKRFIHWNTSSDDSGTTYRPGDPVNSDLVLYAIYDWNTYFVDASVINGRVSSLEDITVGVLNTKIIPANRHCQLPDSVSVMMGETDISNDVEYDSSTGEISYSPVAGDIHISAICPFIYEHAGTVEDPFDVIEGLQKCVETGTTQTQEEYVVKGIISFVNNVNNGTMYNNATYFISDDGSRNDELEIYRGYYIDHADFTEETAKLMKPGMLVTVKGYLVNYKGNTKEMTTDNYLVEIKNESDFEFDVKLNYTSSIFLLGSKGNITITLPDGFVYKQTSDYKDDKSFVSSNPDVFVAEFDMHEITSTGLKIYDWKAVGLGSTVAVVTVKGYLDVPQGDPMYGKLAIGVKRLSVSVYENKTSAQIRTLGASLEEGEYSTERVLYRGQIWGYNGYTLDVSDGVYAKTMLIYFGSSNASVLEEIYAQGGQYKCGLTVWLLCQYSKKNGEIQLVNPALFTSCSLIPITINDTARQFLVDTGSTCSYISEGEHYHPRLTDEEYYEQSKENYENLFYRFFVIGPYWKDISSTDKESLVNAASDEEGTHIQQMLARYDYIVAKYGVTNYIGREITPLQMSNLIQINSENSASIILITVITFVAISSCLVLLIIKKRKQIHK